MASMAFQQLFLLPLMHQKLHKLQPSMWLPEVGHPGAWHSAISFNLLLQRAASPPAELEH